MHIIKIIPLFIIIYFYISGLQYLTTIEMNLKGKKILVTGATGMVGSHLLFKLVGNGNDIIALKRRSSIIKRVLKTFNYYSDNAEELFSEIRWVEGDILDYQSIENALTDVDFVFHAAAEIGFDSKKKSHIIKNNIKGTANVVNASLKCGIEKLCHVSSIAALDSRSNGTVIDEEIYKSDIEKPTAYSVSKFQSELEVWRGISEGLKAVIVNPSIILGPGKWDKGSPLMIKTVWEGMKYFTNGASGFTDVRDVVDIMIKLTESDVEAERFIINTENLLYKEVFSNIAVNLGKDKPSLHANSFMLQSARILDSIRSKLLRKQAKLTKETVSAATNKSSYSNKKITKTLNYKFISINDSIKDICEVFLKENAN